MSNWVRSILVILLPTLLGVFVMTALSRLFVLPLIFNDTLGFVHAALWIPDMAGYRTPLYGWLLIFARYIDQPLFPVWFQIFWWILCVASFTTLILVVTNNRKTAMITGSCFVVIETMIMASVGAQWFLLSDPLYADWVTLGFFLMLIGRQRSTNTVILAGAMFIGISTLLRPIPVTIVLGTMILLHGTTIRNIMKSQRIVSGIIFLTVPIILLASVHKIIGGSFSPSPLKAINLAYYTNALLEPEDKIYDDPELNKAFHDAVERQIVDPAHSGMDPFFLVNYPDLRAEFLFFGSLSTTKSVVVKRFEVAKISQNIARQLILRHPFAYAHLVFAKTLRTMIPSQPERAKYFMRKDTFEFYQTLGYVWQSERGTQWRMGRNIADPLEADMRIAHWFDAEEYGIRLPKKAGPITLVLLCIGTTLMLTESIRRLRSTDARMQTLGLSILVCIGHTYLNALAIALVTLHDDPRYGLPGIMTGTAAILLTFVSLSMSRFPYSISIIRGPDKN